MFVVDRFGQLKTNYLGGSKMKCVLCKNEIEVESKFTWAEGHNALPLADGRCCGTCNAISVIPARMNQLRLKRTKQNK